MKLEEIRKKHSAGHVTSFKYPMNVIADYNNDVRTLLSLIDKYEEEVKPAFGESIISPLVLKLQAENQKYKTALESIVNYDDGLLRQYEELGELVGIYEKIAKQALEKE